MSKQHFFILFFTASCFLSFNVFSQREVPLEEEEIVEDLPEEETEEIETEIQVYSIFNDFRIPTRENINTSDLRYDGWVTEPGMYTFRCKDGKRVRLTYWYLDRGAKEVLDSEFINVTPAIGDCEKDDIEYKEQNYRQRK